MPKAKFLSFRLRVEMRQVRIFFKNGSCVTVLSESTAWCTACHIGDDARRISLDAREAQRLQPSRPDEGRNEAAGHRRAETNPKGACAAETPLTPARMPMHGNASLLSGILMLARRSIFGSPCRRKCRQILSRHGLARHAEEVRCMAVSNGSRKTNRLNLRADRCDIIS